MPISTQSKIYDQCGGRAPLVYQYICYRANGAAQCSIPLSDIVDGVGAPRQAVQRAIKSLAASGWVEVASGGNGRGDYNTYKVGVINGFYHPKRVSLVKGITGEGYHERRVSLVTEKGITGDAERVSLVTEKGITGEQHNILKNSKEVLKNSKEHIAHSSSALADGGVTAEPIVIEVPDTTHIESATDASQGEVSAPAAELRKAASPVASRSTKPATSDDSCPAGLSPEQIKKLGKHQVQSVRDCAAEWLSLDEDKRQVLGYYLVHRVNRTGQRPKPINPMGLKANIKRFHAMDLPKLNRALALTCERNWLEFAKDDWVAKEDAANPTKTGVLSVSINDASIEKAPYPPDLDEFDRASLDGYRQLLAEDNGALADVGNGYPIPMTEAEFVAYSRGRLFAIQRADRMNIQEFANALNRYRDALRANKHVRTRFVGMKDALNGDLKRRCAYLEDPTNENAKSFYAWN